MASIITNKLRKSIAQSIYDEIFSRRSHYYYFFGKPRIGASLSSTPLATQQYEATVRGNIVAAKRIYSSDVAFVVPRFDWVSGVVYDKSNILQTGIVTPAGPKFYVYDTVNHRVFKCIDNNNGGASTVRPTNTEPFNFKTSDGYTWRYLYSIPTALRNKFLTSAYIPVFTSIQKRYYSDGGIAEVTIVKSGFGYTAGTTTIQVVGDGTSAELIPVIVNGQIGDVIIKNPGRDYTRAIITVLDSGSGQGAEIQAELNIGDLESDQALVELLTTSGTVDSVDIVSGGTEYTTGSSVKIIGDGVGATAQLEISAGVITRVLVTNVGEGYTWAQAVITPQVNPPRSGTATNASTRVNVSPFLGHGRNAIDELHANTLMFFSSVFSDRLSDFDTNTTYKQYGLIKDIRNFDYTPNIYDQVSPNRYQVEADFGPQIRFSGGAGTGVRGRVNVTGRTVVDVEIENGGSGFTTTPTVSFSGGGGTVSLNVKTTNGSTVATTTSTANLIIGAVLSNNSNLQANTKIASITNSTTFVMDKAATGTDTVGITTTFATTASASATIVARLFENTTSVTYGGVGYSFPPSVSLSATKGTGGSLTTVMSKGIGAVVVRNGGSGYTSAPTVAFVGGGGTDATAIAEVYAGKITKVLITNPGKGYTTEPTVTFTGNGSGEVVDIVLTDTVDSLLVDRTGAGYNSPPVATFNGSVGVSDIRVDDIGEGFGALVNTSINTTNGSTTATMVSTTGIVAGTVIFGNPNIPSGTRVQTVTNATTIVLSDAATGTASSVPTTFNLPTVTITGGGGNGATAVAMVDDAIRSIVVTSQGTGYITAPTVGFSGGGGTGAAGTAVLSGGRVIQINITSRGTGYTSAPTITLTPTNGGAGATAVAVVSRGLVSVNVTNPGVGYSSSPTITIGASGSRKGFVLTPLLGRATASIGVTGSVTSISLLNGGLNYTSVPTVSISGGGGTGAIAYAKVTGRVTSVTIDNGGTGYSAAPTAVITGGEGTGATVRTTINGSGVVTGVTVTNGGNNYVLTKFATFPIGTILVDEVGNEYTVMSAKTNGKTSSLIVQSNAGFPIVGRMKLRKFGASDYFVTETALSQKFLESRFPVACYEVYGDFDINDVPPNSSITQSDQTNGDKYFNVISTESVTEATVRLLLQPTNGGVINNNNVLSNGITAFTVQKVIKPDIDTRTGEILMISNSDVDFTQNEDQSLSFRTIINF
jgi:hypothetical protein